MLWEQPFVNDEIWLRVRRVLIDRLDATGLTLSAAALHEGLAEERRLGLRMLAQASDELGANWAATLQGEHFLGAGARRFQLRLPFILAFGASYAEALMDLAPPVHPERADAIRFLSALFNLGIVIIDGITDDPARFGDVAAIFGDRDQKILLTGRPSDAAGASDTSAEMTVLQQLVARYFAGVGRLSRESDPVHLDRLGMILANAYAAQMATAAGADRSDDGRAKSVIPFLVAPTLLEMVLDAVDAPPLTAIGTAVGEGFWRVDDLVDFSRDRLGGEANLVATRLGPVREREPAGADLLQTDLVEQVAAEAVAHFEAALIHALDEGLSAERLRRWITLYTLDWLQ